MSDSSKATGIEHRRDERLPLDEAVAVTIDPAVIAGSGQNISSQGVFFTADGALPVRVRIGGDAAERRGELVRFETMGGGRVGIAIRFVEPLPQDG